MRLFLIGGPFSRPINRFPFPDSFQILQLMKHMKEGREGVKRELGLALLWTGKMGFTHWDWD